MRKIWNQLGLEPWDYEINLRIDQGMDQQKAKELVIQRWMQAGDLRPLSAAIKKDGLLRGSVLSLLVQMIDTGQLRVPAKQGRPQDPEAAARDEFAADTYEEFLKDPAGVGSDDLFRAVAAVCGVSEQSVRQAVTDRRRKPQVTH
jgi:hypothetical protein